MVRSSELAMSNRDSEYRRSNSQSKSQECRINFLTTRVQISNGNVISESSGQADFQGRVSPNGSVWVSLSAGGQQADGQGRLNRNLGTGTWRGQGSAGTCAGIWQAERRG